ncbi:MAG: SAM-dependent DNA methyltransferase [Candidatus Hydrogenedentes bacterium]|nr:SAM-dependent DNA methyltransferase [Candidatus Hydrogenedentota bacterium]
MISKKEFGDFQTPLSLARRVVAMLSKGEGHVCTVIEPTCGLGAFLRASAEIFGELPKYWGFDVNPAYVREASAALAQIGLPSVTIQQRDFYTIDWHEFFREQPSPLLVVGNPPWITNAEMGVIRGNNLPAKSNFQGHGGFAAKTGKANFDISEWMLIRLLEALQGTRAELAMLCKTSTARKVLRHAWTKGLGVGSASLHQIDAAAEFGVSVDACLLHARTGSVGSDTTATVYRDLSFETPMQTFGLCAGDLVSDIDVYCSLRDLDGLEYRKWRSGVKHDAAKVMEFTRVNNSFINGLGECCDLEDCYMFPLLKSSDLANNRLKPTRFVLLTQRRVADPTDEIEKRAPKTWQYLNDHAEFMDRRGSSIYANRPRFSVFGVGEYSFSPAKVAISGLYKNFKFRAIGSAAGKPVMVDDTCYFVPCESKAEADYFANLLNRDTAQRFISSLVFRDAKRPITIEILKRIDLKKLAVHAGQEEKAIEYLSSSCLESDRQGVLVFEERVKYRTRRLPVPLSARGRASRTR